jgi:hypothetical protein
MKQKEPDSKLERSIIMILMKAGVSDPEIDECIEWAFGPEAWYLPVKASNLVDDDWLQRWNKLHPGYFKVQPKDKFVEFMFVVGKCFIDQKYRGVIIPGNN